ncbi:pyridoxamine 5'-phosphate oxidase family protein [Streptomyces sp. NPDC058330]|uniref:pyridoxamine 5'-phosphate oxidase family protein n=1 Tax=Streptomyces sp. NPDC058330 TaxID=3346449 RepID=UPI0036E644B6
MNYAEILHLMETDPVIRTLIEAPIPMRLGYVGLDGHPRAVPVSYIWNGKAFVFATPTGAYKVKALTAHPQVAFTVDTTTYTPLTMNVRGTASVEIRQGIPLPTTADCGLRPRLRRGAGLRPAGNRKPRRPPPPSARTGAARLRGKRRRLRMDAGWGAAHTGQPLFRSVSDRKRGCENTRPRASYFHWMI